MTGLDPGLLPDRYWCADDRRREAVRDADPPTLNGIDYVEVDLDPDPLGPARLRVVFVHDLPGGGGPEPVGTALDAGRVRVTGGVRFRDPVVEDVAAAGRVLTVTMRAGQLYDFSFYRLALVRSPADPRPPDGFDPELAAVAFSFKAGCPSDLDCRPEASCPPAPRTAPPISYLAKDYDSFVRLMLDRMGTLLPAWRERNPADQQVMMVEMLAAVADQLSWQQDAVATEAYLGTARLRTSLRRHARLLDYPVHDGCNARAFVCFTMTPSDPAEDGAALPAGARLLTRGLTDTARVPPEAVRAALGDGPTVFETMHDLALFEAHNGIAFHTWSGARCVLPAGATRATLRDEGRALRLEAGDFLLIEETADPATGAGAEADRRRRQVVRLTAAERSVDPLDGAMVVEAAWAPADALAFPLCLDVEIGMPPRRLETAVARGNVALADSGLSLPVAVPGPGGVVLYDAPSLDPPVVPEGGRRYRPRLSAGPVARAEPYDERAPASTLLRQDLRAAVALVRLVSDGVDGWQVERDLIGSGRFERDVVVEAEADGTASLRFGDGVHGTRPVAGTRFAVGLRVGGGSADNVGAEALARVVTDLPGIAAVRNPLPATGGTDPESAQQIRAFAPDAFRIQERAVTLADYAEVAERHPEVAHARARLCWTGGWHTVFLHVDRRGGRPVDGDADFLARLSAHVDRYRLMGHDLEIRGPVPAPLDIELFVCAAPRALRPEVRRRVLRALGTGWLPDGGRAFFHADEWTFGQSLPVSRLVAAVMAVPGVASVELRTLKRFGRPEAGEREAGIVVADELEILTLANDPSFPENGTLRLEIGGGA